MLFGNLQVLLGSDRCIETLLIIGLTTIVLVVWHSSVRLAAAIFSFHEYAEIQISESINLLLFNSFDNLNPAALYVISPKYI